jgi:hypothetical protein
VQVTVSNTDGMSNGVPYSYVQLPQLTSLNPTQGLPAGGTTVTLTGVGLSGATAVNFGATPATSFAVVSDTQVTAVAPAGAGTAQVKVTTAAGTSNGLSFTYAGAAVVPTVVSINPNSGPVTGGAVVTLTGTGFTGATAVNFGATPATFYGVFSDSLIVAVAPPGTGTVPVTVTTAAGTSAGVSFTYVPVPTLTAISPTSGPVTGGTTVTLTGTGFTGATTVLFGILPATSFTVVSDTQITAVTPVGFGTVQVRVITPGGISNAVNYTYVLPPILFFSSPLAGPQAGGTTVTLTGVGLSGTTAVNFGATPATSFTVLSDNQVTAVAPPGTGTVQVTATTPSGTSNGVPFTYVGAPVVPSVVSISPSSGPVTGGVVVTLTGTGFTGATAVNFGATPATFYGVFSDSLIVALAPPGTGTVPVTVTTAAGTSAGISFTYVPVPTLTAISPVSGSASGGTTVTLAGTGFTGATAVLFGATPAMSFTVNSDTQITAVAPAGLGTVPVTVVGPGGTSAGVSFTYS